MSPFIETKNLQKKKFVEDWDKACGKIKESLSSNISGFLKRVLSKFGFNMIKEIMRLGKEDNDITLKVGNLEKRINSKKKNTETLQEEINTTIQDREKLSKKLVDTFFPDYLPVKYKCFYGRLN